MSFQASNLWPLFQQQWETNTEDTVLLCKVMRLCKTPPTEAVQDSSQVECLSVVAKEKPQHIDCINWPDICKAEGGREITQKFRGQPFR